MPWPSRKTRPCWMSCWPMRWRSGPGGVRAAARQDADGQLSERGAEGPGPPVRYVSQWHDHASAVLELEADLDDVYVQDVDILRWNGEGRLVSFPVMGRLHVSVLDAGQSRFVTRRTAYYGPAELLPGHGPDARGRLGHPQDMDTGECPDRGVCAAPQWTYITCGLAAPGQQPCWPPMPPSRTCWPSASR
jgi:hypothetical protein